MSALIIGQVITMQNMQGMELPIQDRMKNAQDVCQQLSGCDLKMFNLIDDLWSLPICYAIDTMRYIDSDWITQVENHDLLIELVKSNTLDDHVACAVAEKLDDLALAYQLAQRGEITHSVASMIVNDFLKADITTCVSDFDNQFHKAFPEKILAYGNDSILYSALIKAMTENYWFVVGDITNHLFSMRDFNISMSSTENSMPNIQMSCATMDSEEKFLLLCKNKHFIHIINLGTKIGLGIVVPVKVEGVVFKKDNVTSFGILDTSGKIHEFAMPLALLRAEVPLQQLAALVYCKVQVYKKTKKSVDCMGHTILESQDCGEEKKLIKFIQENLHEEWTPPFLRATLKKDSENLHDVILLRNAFTYMACTLGVTREQVAIDLYVNKKDTSWSVLHQKQWDWATDFLVQTFGGTFKQLYWFKEQ